MALADLRFWSGRRQMKGMRPVTAGPTRDEPEDVAFDEAWYLKAHPDVAEAITAGVFGSGRQHYRLYGRNEKRARSRADITLDPETDLADLKPLHSGGHYLVPRDLSRPGFRGNRPDFRLRRSLVIGLCLAEVWSGFDEEIMDFAPDFLLVHQHAVLPATLPHPAAEYDVFLVQLPLRGLTGDGGLWSLAYHDEEGHRRVFNDACAVIDHYVERVGTWAEQFGVPVLFTNFFLPQGDLTGRLLPRYDLRNIIHYVEELNRHLGRSISAFRSAKLLDIDRIAASFGRRFVQDDSVFWMMHGGVMPPDWQEPPRIEPMRSVSEHYDVTWPSGFVKAIWAEASAIVRSLRQVDLVKLVVVDLDDTLWSGVSGDRAEIDMTMIEGWPRGIAEALMYLKKRGVLLAIISKNDEERIGEIWHRIFGGTMTLDDFATVRINWRRKSENMTEILKALNLLSENTVFIDDNPVERAEMRHAYSDMRILGRYPFYVRRILLWASETQGATISAESADRTRSIQAKIERDTMQVTLDRTAFLATLSLKVVTREIHIDNPRLARALELLNKTNQFNTTGRRWTQAEIEEAANDGQRIFVFEAEDKFTTYGLIGVCLVVGESIEQLVMSCRVNGLDVEVAALSEILPQVASEGQTITARLIPTRVNLLCRDIWTRCGFDRDPQDAERWMLPPHSAPSRPAHIS